jgi:uncharacterized protein YndB with AHSA1/START domain
MTFTPRDLNPELDLELVRDVPVAPELVWKAWTDPELLKQWFAPAPFAITECAIDLRPGGEFSFTMRTPDGEEYPNAGCILDVIEGERLVFTECLGAGYRPRVAEIPMTAILELTPNGSGGTIYRAVAIHLDPAGQKAHEEMGFHEGWGATLD